MYCLVTHGTIGMHESPHSVFCVSFLNDVYSHCSLLVFAERLWMELGSVRLCFRTTPINLLLIAN
jgi:hypothetical protein